MSKPANYCYVGACAAATFVWLGIGSVAAEAALPTLVFDLRVHETGSKEAVLGFGQTALLDLYATVYGLDADPTNDTLALGSGSFRSSAGGLAGTLLGVRAPAPFNQTGSSLGTQQDLDGDGDLDVGSNDPANALDYYVFRAGSPGPAQPPGGHFVGQVRFTPSRISDATTQIDFTLRASSSTGALVGRVDDALSFVNHPSRVTVVYNAPVTVRVVPTVDPNIQYIGGVITSQYSITGSDTRVVGDDITIAAGGAIHQSGGSSSLESVTVESEGLLNVAGGNVTVFNDVVIRRGGEMAHSLGKTVVGGALTVGDLPSPGLLRVQGGEIQTAVFRIGATMQLEGGIGRVEQTGGTVQAGSVSMASPDDGYASTYALSGGRFEPGSFLMGSNALFTQSGGVLGGVGAFVVGGGSHGQLQFLLSEGSIERPHLRVNQAQQSSLPGSGLAGAFVQTGGDVAVGELVVGQGGIYHYHGGTLSVGKSLALMGSLEFAGNPVTVQVSGNAFADFADGNLLGASNAAVTAGAGSLLIFASQSQFNQLSSVQTQGLIHIAGQPLNIPQDESVGGSGTIEGNVTNNGVIAPGQSPGIISVTGNFAQAETGELVMEIAGTATDKFDVLSITGSASLDGDLQLSLLDGFVPQPTDSFAILTAAGVSGKFDNAIGMVDFAGGRFDVLYSPTGVTLTNFQAVPEPPAAALAMSAAATCLRRRHRRTPGSARRGFRIDSPDGKE